MDGLISRKPFYYKNLVFFYQPKLFFLFDVSCMFAFADLSFKLHKNKTKQKIQNKDIQDIGLGMLNKNSFLFLWPPSFHSEVTKKCIQPEQKELISLIVSWVLGNSLFTEGRKFLFTPSM